ncbi:hypothetical protein NliqN6_4933 [Naganishia liquefaciens]|uniref:DNA-directed RNA polymerase III subunit RPC9 n=1 Tax=Naganishia liquefaciens TaxID=104408 RepID=A0A8H3TVV1_9TREE|nr:hypothetical protein NliqN6_4933 [Naganishia liquefaciens]
MNVVKARAALLSDYEVLLQFQSQHEDNKKITEAIAEQKAAIKAKQDGDWRAMKRYDSLRPERKQEQNNLAIRGVTDDLLFATEQVNAYLSGPLSHAKQQNPHGIQKLLQGLPQFKLTKAEELQIINLAPKKIIELYLIIDECDERLNDDQQQELLDLVQQTLDLTPTEDMTMIEDHEEIEAEYDAINDEEHQMHWDEQGGDMEAEEEFYAESKWGGGAGIEDEGDGAIDE